MTTLYLVCLLAGTVAFLAVLAWNRLHQGRPGGHGAPEEEMTVPGARIEPSDDYAVEGGAGGAEGVSGSFGYSDGADGGVGGAEGGVVPRAQTIPMAWTFLAAFVSGLGAAGYLALAAGGSTLLGAVVAVAGGVAVGGLGCAAAVFVQGERAQA